MSWCIYYNPFSHSWEARNHLDFNKASKIVDLHEDIVVSFISSGDFRKLEPMEIEGIAHEVKEDKNRSG